MELKDLTKMTATNSDYASLNPKGIEAHDNHIIVHTGPLKTKTEGGLFLPRAVAEENGTGIVISVGHGVERIAVGDKITWKDSVTFAKDKMVTNDSSVWVDQENRLVAVRKDMVIAKRKNVSA